MAKVVALQMVSTDQPANNLQVLEQHLQQLNIDQPTLVVLPECFACFAAGDKALLALAETAGTGPIQQQLAQLAQRYAVWLCAGTLPLKTSKQDKYSASSLLFNAQGDIVAEYQKIHLFDVQVDDNTGSYCESRFTEAGNQVVVVKDTPFGTLGLAVCYDLRFAGLFQAMGQVDILLVPAAFTRKTGAAHWHSLITARSIEKQCYLVAANQGGVHANGRETYGHSCIVSPWGEILKQVKQGAGIASSVIDTALLQSIRAAMPVYQHNQFRSHFVAPR